MSKLRKNITFGAMVIIVVNVIVLALLLIPVSSKSIGCSADKRYGILLGETDAYNNDKGYFPAYNPEMGTCAPAEGFQARLYLL